MLTKILSLDFKKTPVYFNWNFPTVFNGLPLLTLRLLKELDQGEKDVKDSLV